MQDIIDEKAISLYEVKAYLTKIKKRDGELNFRANKTEEYVDSVLQLTQKKAEELRKALDKLKIPRLKDGHISKIIDTLPSTNDDLKVVIQGFAVTINGENSKKIVAAINDVK